MYTFNKHIIPKRLKFANNLDIFYNSYMYELYPYFTNDGSVGLFSPSADDIYHSTYGALTEAYEKFILPSNIEKFIKKNSEIKILDICFGIGYNSKSFLNFFLNLLYNETTDTDKNINIDKIYTNNKKYKIYIHALDNDKNLAYLSPFFICNKKKIKNNNLLFYQEKIKKMLATKTVQKYKLKDEVNFLLLEKIADKIDSETIQILNSNKYNQFFDRNIINFFKFLRNQECKYTPLNQLISFLHNIYYKYISKGYKNALKALNLVDFNFNLEIDDARLSLKRDNIKYNYIFLDAFTPTKCPCLWTVDFLRLLYSHLEDGGMILTYSNSAQVRNAFINVGFVVGKIYSESSKKFTGTIAVKCKLDLDKLISEHKQNNAVKIFELSEYDLGLIKTKAGIFYRDENLSLDNEAIIKAHEIEFKNSNLLSSSKFIKEYKKLNKGSKLL